MTSVLKKLGLLILICVCILILMPYNSKALAQSNQPPSSQPSLQNVRKFFTVRVLAFSPDSKYLITGDTLGSISLWDLENNTKKYTLPHSFLVFGPHSGEVSSVAFSSDGNFFATGGTDKTVRVWQTATGKLLYNADFKNTIKSIAFYSNKELFVTENNSIEIKTWNLNDSTIVSKTPENYDADSGSLFINNESDIFWSFARNGTIKFWDINTSSLVKRFDLNDYNPKTYDQLDYIDEVVFDPKSQIIAFLGKYKGLKRRYIGTLNLISGVWNDLGQPARVITAFAVNANKNLLAVGGYYANTDSDKTFGNEIYVRLITENGSQFYRYTFPPNSPLVNFLSFSPNGKILISRDAEENTFVWKLPL